jgi:Ala-tRNA(Pro) deacylase
VSPQDREALGNARERATPPGLRRHPWPPPGHPAIFAIPTDERFVMTDPSRPADAPPATAAQLLARLNALGIAARTVEHAAVFTVDQARRVRGDLPGTHTKSLFLRDPKEAMWLVVCLEDRPVDLRRLADHLGARRLSFGSPARLMRHLGVIPGAVSPFAVINDRAGAVRVVLDREVLARDPVNLHPLDNTKTTAIAAADLLRFLEAEGHPPVLLDFAEG